MNEGLPDKFDVVVIGTGITESIVSAACSRNGHSVLHLDVRDYYGGSWATLNFDSWITGNFTKTPDAVSLSSINNLKWRDNFRNFEQVWYCTDENLKSELQKNCRRFNIDLLPKVILAREEVIELLIKSNVSRYLEFLRVGKLLASLPTPSDTVIESIPLSRSDIFTSKSVSLVEKRSLVKFIEAILKSTELKKSSESVSSEDEDQLKIKTKDNDDEPTKSFDELVQIYKLSEKVKHLIKSAVQTLEDNFQEDNEDSAFNQMFVARCRIFLQSIGRYGNQTPYLWTLYGISEICQAFCRLSAVYGGLFILKRYISTCEETKNGVKIVSENDEFFAQHLILGPELEYIRQLDSTFHRKVAKTVGRGVILTIGGNLKTEDSKPGSKGDGIYLYSIGELEVIELNHLSQAVPKEYRLLQISFAVNKNKVSVSPKEKIESILGPYVDFTTTPIETSAASKIEDSASNLERSSCNIFNSDEADDENSPNRKPRVLYGSYFLVDLFEEKDLCCIKKEIDDSTEFMARRILSCATGSTDIASHVAKAREIFEKIFPNEEFLPKAPDMEDNIEDSGIDETESEIVSEEHETSPEELELKNES